MGSVTYPTKCIFGLFQRVNLVFMSPSSHVDIFYTHFKSFMHCHTSVIIVVAKSTFNVALGKVIKMSSH